MDRRDDDLPRVTLDHLRRPEDRCARRLALEHTDQRGNRRGSARFDVRNRLVEDARLAHAVPGPPDASAFASPRGVFEEERRVFDHAARTYLRLVGEEAVTLVGPERLDPWATTDHVLGVRLLVPLDLVVEHPDGIVEVRTLRVGAGTDVDDDQLRCLRLRTGDLATRGVRVRVLDLWAGTESASWIEGGREEHQAARAWLHERVAAVRARAAHPVPRAGAECSGCAYVAGCGAHRDP